MLVAESDVFCAIRRGSRRREQIGHRGRETTVLRGFRDFILGGNVVELAVAVVIGVAFGAVVNSVVTNLITPLIALVGGTPDFSRIRTGPVLGGSVSNDVWAFLITPAVVYFVVVLPMSRALARMKPSEPPPRPTRGRPERLSDLPHAATR